MNCQTSAQYGKDNNKTLHFYCNYCDKEMDFREIRSCNAIPPKCNSCGALIGNDEQSVNHCLCCDKELGYE